MMEDQYCEGCGRKNLTHCSFCGTSLEAERAENTKKPEVWLDITIQLPQYDGIDVDELRACHNCTAKFLTKEAVRAVTEATDLALGTESLF